MPGPDFTRQDDVVDAEFISLGSNGLADNLVPVAATRSLDAPVADGMAMLLRDTAPAPGPSPGGPMFWAGGTVIAFAAFWVSGGHAIMDVSDITSVSDPTGLRIASVISRVDRSGERPILMVDGKAVNDGASPIAMPSLQIEVVTTAGGSALYKLGTAGRSLDGGDFFDFSSRLDLPKDGVETVLVTFAQ